MSFLGFLKRRQGGERVADAALPRVPAGERVYAIGDIHGRDDLFKQLLAKVEADNAARGKAFTTLILLGDLVDRGPDSASVIERALGIGAPFDKVAMLVGNHEECFLAALTGDLKRVRYFIRIGGDATIRSYWCDDAAYAAMTFEEVAEQLPGKVPQAHVDFLNRGEDMIQIGDYVFVHAGIRPGVPLDRQKLPDLRWIREEFIHDDQDHGVTIVHGHTISEDVDETRNRIGIDTGAYLTGRLTALGLEGDRRWYLDTADFELN
ncbi:serine/threonine protein phosphatase [Sphingopyxis sp. H050]|jgi:serine/threonine protein phosphatase 1|uniref:metallophosphoesterase family protein n=1 Tax=Sphingopyxis sp. H050 TaxID=1759072 RepID=UPI00073708DD|nr:metallophosphoesterase family protein [Sphingopyxis sp. H050]KTE19233.1 serine/threonine protein phosphatase [Sphingopyxis sp. H050]